MGKFAEKLKDLMKGKDLNQSALARLSGINVNQTRLMAFVIAGLMAGIAACVFSTAALAATDWRAEAISMLKRDFQAKGQAAYERIHEDELQAECNRSSNNPPEAVATRMMQDQAKTVKYPADGKLMGDWKVGEKIAQSGKGFTWTDEPGLPVGGNCYNCHQIDKKEISYGTIGPSLYNYGKLRGVKDVADPATAAVVQYTWGKLWNSKAYAACSNMPRFGHMKLLDESQIRDLMALLLDPKSPVNQ